MISHYDQGDFKYWVNVYFKNVGGIYIIIKIVTCLNLQSEFDIFFFPKKWGVIFFPKI